MQEAIVKRKFNHINRETRYHIEMAETTKAARQGALYHISRAMGRTLLESRMELMYKGAHILYTEGIHELYDCEVFCETEIQAENVANWINSQLVAKKLAN